MSEVMKKEDPGSGSRSFSFNTGIFRRRGYLFLIILSLLVVFTFTAYLFYDSFSMKLSIPDIIDRIPEKRNETLEEAIVYENLLSPQNAHGIIPECQFFVVVLENDMVRRKNERVYEINRPFGDEVLTFCEKCNIVQLLLMMEEKGLEGKLCVVSDSIAVKHEKVVNIVPDISNLIFQIDCLHKHEKAMKILELNDQFLKFTLSVVFSSFLESSFYVDTNLYFSNEKLVELLFSTHNSSTFLLENDEFMPHSFLTVGEDQSKPDEYFKFTTRFFKLTSTSFMEQFRLSLCDRLFKKKDVIIHDDSSKEIYDQFFVKQNNFLGSLLLEEFIEEVAEGLIEEEGEGEEDEEEVEDKEEMGFEGLDQIGIVGAKNIFCSMNSADEYFLLDECLSCCLVYDFLDMQKVDERTLDFINHEGCFLDIVRLDH